MDIKGSFKKSRSISSPPASNENDELLIPAEMSRNSALPPSADVKGILSAVEMQGTTKVNKQESYKAQRKHYRREKKRVAKELLSTLRDPSIVILADWLKVRGTLKGWTKLWCVLKPGLLLLYKSPKTHKSSQWVGTVMLNACELIERPSKKDGFCFKLFHPLEQSIWGSRGPRGETIGAITQPFPMSYLIFRAPSESAGKYWMDALELALRCSSLLMKTMINKEDRSSFSLNSPIDVESFRRTSLQWNESDLEQHFKDQGEELGSSRSPNFSPSSANTAFSPYLSPFNYCFKNVTASSCPSPTSFYPCVCMCHQYHQQLVLRKASDGSMKLISLALNQHVENENVSCGNNSNKHVGNEQSEISISIPKHISDPTSSKIKELPSPGMLYTTHTQISHTASKHTSSFTHKPDSYITPPSVSTIPDLEDDIHTDENREGNGTHSVHSSESDSDVEENLDVEPVETVYVENGSEEFGTAGDVGQTEEVEEENKSLIWTLVKQVRPGMDLSRVVLPTFILEPRSFLDKLSDYYYHSDILAKAVQEDDPFTRMKTVVQWYLSGFYKKPKGLKKPYNPILGETFRCYWINHDRDSRTFYIAEQVSHHPPVSAFYVTNRKDGFCISGSILAKSKFYGNSLSAILDGTARLTLLTRGEDYLITMPYAHCKGILVGTLTMELGGKVTIVCEKTRYRTELEFKLKPFLGGPELCNLVTGKIKLGKETLATIEGHWDAEIYFMDKRIEEEHILWNPTSEVRGKRLKRYTVLLELQNEFESERLWQRVSEAISQCDQVAATEEKTLLEEAQRQAAKERQIKMEKWSPKYFFQDIITGEWVYKYADLRPWDPRNDLVQYEQNYVIQTKTHHKTPVVRTGSTAGIDSPSKGESVHMEHLLSTCNPSCFLQKGNHHRRSLASHGSESSSPDGEVVQGSDSTESDVMPLNSTQRTSKSTITLTMLQESLQPVQRLQEESNQTLQAIQNHLEAVMAQQQRVQQQLAQRNDLTIVASVLLIQIILHCLLHWWS
ncbi:oxysterol-binding protein-related protein 8 isoform X2 [Tachypleus tridentatus]|uniref:oxysterol-binding protein-related protein 8 isoform X2 n=1 Tax=Tachypleus tridentatus TaxID=6853 RepID=UPI003FCFCB85